VTGPDGDLSAIEDGDAGALDDHEHLVEARVALLADLAAGRQAHHDHLGVRPGREDAAEEIVVLRRGDDVDREQGCGVVDGHGDSLAPGLFTRPVRAGVPEVAPSIGSVRASS
jgi:hypothetical protein